MAIRVFNLSDKAKGLFSAATHLGQVMAPIALNFFTKIYPLENNRAISALLFLMSLAIIMATWTDQGMIFLICIILAQILYKLTLPFVTDIYNHNYPKIRRGQIIGLLFTISSLSGVGLSYFIGKMFDRSMDNYRLALFLATLSALICGYIFLKMPNGRVVPQTSAPLFHSKLSILFNDKLFLLILFLWSLMSVGFHMISPLRTEYITNMRHGINLSNSDVTTLMATIPALTRIFSCFFWGRVFDTQNFAVMKILVNCCYLISIPMFFFAESFSILVLSSIILGLGYTGHLTAWQLWVMKIAPSTEKLGAYVSINMIVMGLRDILSSGLGYYLLSKSVPLHTICIIAAILVAISTFGFVFLIKNPRLR
jgi:hypothetical protein